MCVLVMWQKHKGWIHGVVCGGHRQLDVVPCCVFSGTDMHNTGDAARFRQRCVLGRGAKGW